MSNISLFKGNRESITRVCRETFKQAFKESERSFILKILEETNWTIQGKHGAAARLGIAPSSLRDRIKKHGLKRPL